MFRLAITLIKKYGFQQAKKMAPKFGVDGQAWKHAENIMRTSQRGTRRTWGNPIMGREGMHMTPQRPHYTPELSRQMRAPAVRPREIGQGPRGIMEGLERIGRHTAPALRPDPYAQRLKNIDVLVENMKRYKAHGGY